MSTFIHFHELPVFVIYLSQDENEFRDKLSPISISLNYSLDESTFSDGLAVNPILNYYQESTILEQVQTLYTCIGTFLTLVYCSAISNYSILRLFPMYFDCLLPQSYLLPHYIARMLWCDGQWSTTCRRQVKIGPLITWMSSQTYTSHFGDVCPRTAGVRNVSRRRKICMHDFTLVRSAPRVFSNHFILQQWVSVSLVRPRIGLGLGIGIIGLGC